MVCVTNNQYRTETSLILDSEEDLDDKLAGETLSCPRGPFDQRHRSDESFEHGSSLTAIKRAGPSEGVGVQVTARGEAKLPRICRYGAEIEAEARSPSILRRGDDTKPAAVVLWSENFRERDIR